MDLNYTQNHTNIFLFPVNESVQPVVVYNLDLLIGMVGIITLCCLFFVLRTLAKEVLKWN